MQKQTTTSKKHGLHRGMDALTNPKPALIPAETARTESAPAPQSQFQLAGDTIGKVGLVLAEALPVLSGAAREMTLDMIIKLCQEELKSGYRG